MPWFDGDLGPTDMGVLGVLEISRRDAVAGEPAAAVSCHKDRAPLAGRPRAKPLLDDLEGRGRILRSLLDGELLAKLRDLHNLGVGRGLQIGRLDRVPVWSSHRVSLTPFVLPTIAPDTFG